METQPKNEQPTQDLLPYHTPEIIDFGEIEALTQGGAGADSDLQGGSSPF
jgi:hypothetical protein